MCEHNLFCRICAPLNEIALSAVLWGRNKIVMALACAVWLGNIAVYAYSMSVCLPDSSQAYDLDHFKGSVTLRSAWGGGTCMVSNTDDNKINVLSTFGTDVILLVLMLSGLMRWKNAPKSWGIWRVFRMQVSITHPHGSC